MKLGDLIKIESERTKQEIVFDPSITEKPKKVFKKERVWIEEEKPLENQLSINNNESIKKPIITQSSINHQVIANQLPTISQSIANTSNEPSLNELSINNQKTIKWPPSSVVGNEALFLLLIVEECSKHGALQTGRITTDILKAKFNLNANGIANLIFRIKEKGLVGIVEQKLGRVSYRIFSVPKEVYSFFNNQENHHAIIKNTSNNISGKPSNQVPIVDSNLNSLEDKKLNTNQIQIPESLRAVISKREVEDLLSKNLISEADLAQSLEHFGYDFANQLVRAKTNPISLFYGLARSGKPYRSLKLIEAENQDLREFERSLQEAEAENRRLKSLDLREKFEAYKKEHPEFMEEIRLKHKTGAFTLSSELLEKMAFSEFEIKNGQS